MRLSAISKFFTHFFGTKEKCVVVCLGSNSIVMYGFWARIISCIGLYKLYKQERYRLWW